MKPIPPMPTLGEMVTACLHNADVANFQRRRLRQQLRAVPEPGLERDRLSIELSVAEADYHHWSDYVGYYRARVAREGAGALPMMMRHPALVPMAVPVPTRAREPGEDDDDEQRP